MTECRTRSARRGEYTKAQKRSSHPTRVHSRIRYSTARSHFDSSEPRLYNFHHDMDDPTGRPRASPSFACDTAPSRPSSARIQYASRIFRRKRRRIFRIHRAIRPDAAGRCGQGHSHHLCPRLSDSELRQQPVPQGEISLCKSTAHLSLTLDPCSRALPCRPLFQGHVIRSTLQSPSVHRSSYADHHPFFHR